MLKASDLRAGHGDVTIFDSLSLTLSGTRRTGLVGPNGTRQDDAAPAPGRCQRLQSAAASRSAPGDRVGYLPQEPPGPDLTIDRLLGAALGEVWRLHGELERLESRLGEPADARALRRGAGALRRTRAAGRCRRNSTARATRSGSPTSRSTLPSACLSGGEAGASAAGRRAARAGRPSCCSTSRPTTSTSTASSWLEEFLGRLRRRGAGGARTIAASSTRRSRRSSSSTAARSRAYTGGYTAYREAKSRAAGRRASLPTRRSRSATGGWRPTSRQRAGSPCTPRRR